MTTNRDDERESLKQMMKLAEETASHYMETCGQVQGHFMCKGLHGSQKFEFVNPKDETEKADLFHRAYFNCLGVGAKTAVMFFEGHLKGDKRTVDACRVRGEDLPDREVVVLIGETCCDRISRLLPIKRSGDGRFVEFGEALEAVNDKSEGYCLEMVSGEKLTEWQREDALEQAGNFAVLADIEKRKKRERGRGMGMS